MYNEYVQLQEIQILRLLGFDLKTTANEHSTVADDLKEM
jgi:hypothetical protein